MMRRNQSVFYYALYKGIEPIKDEYGNETGEYRILYDDPVKMLANVSAASGYAQVEQFGNLESYDKVIVTDDMCCPICETTVLFIDKEPEFDRLRNPLFDYTVRRVAKSLNSISVAVSKVNVS